MWVPLPTDAKLKIIHETKSFVVDANGKRKLVDLEGAGLLNYILIASSSTALEIRFGLDGNEQTYTIVELDDMGLDEELMGHFWITKFDAVEPRFVVAYGTDFMEPFVRKMFLELRNPTGAPITIRQFEARWYQTSLKRG